MKVCRDKMRRGKGKKKNCSLYKYETNLYKIGRDLMWCVRQCREKCHVHKKESYKCLPCFYQ